MLFTFKVTKPDPWKVKDFGNIKPPIAKIRTSSNFLSAWCKVIVTIPSFIKVVVQLRNLLHEKFFCWTCVHQKTFNELLNKLSNNLILPYLDMTLPTYIFTDVHKTGIAVVLCQSEDFDNLLTVAITSWCTKKAEKSYAQLDVVRCRSYAKDFSLRWFPSNLVGSPNETVVITDHFPVISIFNHNDLVQ